MLAKVEEALSLHHQLKTLDKHKMQVLLTLENIGG